MKRKLLFIVAVICGLSSSALIARPLQDRVARKEHTRRVASGKPAPRMTTKEHVFHTERLLSYVTQNKDNPKGTPKWTKYIQIGGLLNLEALYESDPNFGVRSPTRLSRFSVASAVINVDGQANDWVSAHLGIFYSDRSERYYLSKFNTRTNVVMDEAYATIKNFARTPFYLRGGQQYLPFGSYNRYPIAKTLTQSLSETRATALELGFVTQRGLYGTITGFHGLTTQRKSSRFQLNNMTAGLGFEDRTHAMGINVGVSYILNMADVGEISYSISGMRSYYTHRVGAVSVHGKIFSGPFALVANYVTALKRFSVNDLSYQKDVGNIRGAKPSAASVKASYTFTIKNFDNEIAVGYQHSWEAHNATNQASSRTLLLPRYRIEALYGFQLFRHTIIAAEYHYDQDYRRRNAGTNKGNNAVYLRLTILL